MSLVVFGAPLSPFVRKVRLFAAEKGFDYQLENINPFNQPDWYRELNPLRRVPAIRDGDFTLADSSVICHYLEDRDPQRDRCAAQAPSPAHGSTGWRSTPTTSWRR